MVCCTERKGPFDAHGVTNSITCTECINDKYKERLYIGETSLSAYTRGKEHLTSLSRNEEGSALWKHSKDIHHGHVPVQFRNDAMLGQISEAVRINREGKKNAMNDKRKWNYVHVPHHCGAFQQGIMTFGLNGPDMHILILKVSLRYI